MEEKLNEMITMPDGSVKSFEECMDDILNTRDFSLYLDMLNVLKDRYLIIFSIKDTAGGNISAADIQKIKSLGFTDYTRQICMMYIGIANKGSVVFNRVSDNAVTPVSFEGIVENINLFVSSKSWKCGNTAEIIINDENYSLNMRGTNIVVFDFKTNKVIDSSSYNSDLPKPTFYHKNLEIDEAYFNNHIFVPEKYKEIWRSALTTKLFSNRKLNIKEAKNGVVLPIKVVDGKRYGGACDENYRFISGHNCFSHDAHKMGRSVLESYIPDEGDVQYVDETVLYGGVQYSHPGMLILETIANQLWYLTKVSDPELKIAVIIQNVWGQGDEVYFFEMMDAYGFPRDKIIIVSSPTKFKKLLIPDSSNLMYYYDTSYEITHEYSIFFEHIRNNVTPAKYKKIYLTKTKVKRSNFIGEEYFIEFYRKHGFEIIDPEDYTMKEKAELMLGADEVVVTTGTNNLFPIFCKPSATITVLARIDSYNYTADSIGKICEVNECKNFYVVNVCASFFHKNLVLGLQLLSVTNEFKEYVKAVFNEDIDITPEESLKNVLYEYLKFIPEFYTHPGYFNSLKNQKMLTVLQNMSELFLGKDFDTSKLDLSTNESNLQKQVKDLEAQKNTLTSQVNTLSVENKNLKFAKAQNETEITVLRNDQNKLNAELVEVHRQRDEAGKKIVELYQQKEEVYQKLSESYRQKDEIGKKLLTVTEEKTALAVDISVKKHQIDTFISEKDKLTANVSAKESELLNAASKVKSLESELAAAKDKAQSLESKLSDSTQKIQFFEQECAELKNKISWMENTRSWRYTKPFRKKRNES